MKKGEHLWEIQSLFILYLFLKIKVSIHFNIFTSYPGQGIELSIGLTQWCTFNSDWVFPVLKSASLKEDEVTCP